MAALGALLGAAALAVAGSLPAAAADGTLAATPAAAGAVWVGAGIAFPLVGYLLRRRSLLGRWSAAAAGGKEGAAADGGPRLRDRQCRRMVERARRDGTPISLVMIDLDHLAETSERLGREAAARAVRLAELSITLSCRRSDVSLQHRPDRFVVLAPGTSAIQASLVARRIQATLSELALQHIAGDAAPVPVSVSIGIADLERAAGPDVDALYAAAERAVAEAKLTSLHSSGLALAHGYPRRRTTAGGA